MGEHETVKEGAITAILYKSFPKHSASFNHWYETVATMATSSNTMATRYIPSVLTEGGKFNLCCLPSPTHPPTLMCIHMHAHATGLCNTNTGLCCMRVGRLTWYADALSLSQVSTWPRFSPGSLSDELAGSGQKSNFE